MGDILIDKIRIKGFRGLENIELGLLETTLLTGANNTGKTSVLKALQLALGNRSFLSLDDFYIHEGYRIEKILIDLRIVSINENGERIEDFDDSWDAYFTENLIKYDDEGFASVPFRTEISVNPLRGDFDKKQKSLKVWENEGTEWYDLECTNNSPKFDAIPFFYIEAQRDVVDDIKTKNSYLGRMLSQIYEAYSPEDISELEEMIRQLNSSAIEKSGVLATIQNALEGIDSTIDKHDSHVTLTPFTRSIRDLNKSISIQYGESQNPFTMEYHGMGTRSWSSLLAFKAFVQYITSLVASNPDQPIHPVIAIEEPESHLHPNAQKKLYHQICEIPGQKLISTHSPFVVSSADLYQIRNLHKTTKTNVGYLEKGDITSDDYRKIKQKVVNSKGEILFSDCIVFFEGETEEQALPILAEKHFNAHPSQYGIDFVGVGGAGSYYPFIKYASRMGIPWFIFSDGEDGPVSEMSKTVKKCEGDDSLDVTKHPNVVIIDQKEDFEKYIIRCDYFDDIINYIKSVELPKCVNDQHRAKKEAQIERYTPEYILSESKNKKTEYALIYANAIFMSQKNNPPLITELFNRISKILGHAHS